MESVRPRLKIADILAYLIAYALWVLSAAVSLVSVFQLRNTLNTMWPLFGDSNQWRWTLRPIDRFGLLFSGLAWLVFVIFIEHHYRDGVTLLRFKRDGLNIGPAMPRAPKNALMRFLRRLSLDVLMWRFVTTIGPAIAVFVIAYLLQQLGFWLLTIVR